MSQQSIPFIVETSPETSLPTLTPTHTHTPRHAEHADESLFPKLFSYCSLSLLLGRGFFVDGPEDADSEWRRALWVAQRSEVIKESGGDVASCCISFAKLPLAAIRPTDESASETDRHLTER